MDEKLKQYKSNLSKLMALCAVVVVILIHFSHPRINANTYDFTDEEIIVEKNIVAKEMIEVYSKMPDMTKYLIEVEDFAKVDKIWANKVYGGPVYDPIIIGEGDS